MAADRAPWWMYAAAAPFVCFVAVSCYAELYGPEQPGWRVELEPRGWAVEEVKPGSPAARAGVQPGDLVLALDGAPAAGRGLKLWLWHAESGRSYRLEIQRAGQSRTLSLALARRGLSYWSEHEGHGQLVLLFNSAVFLALGLFVGFARPLDTAARFMALSAAEVAVVFADLCRTVYGIGEFHFFHVLPLPVALAALAGIVVGGATLAPVHFTLFALFPRRLFQSKWIWAALWAPAAFTLPEYILLRYRYVFRPGSAHGLGWITATSDAFAVFGALAIAPALLAWNYRRLRDVNERRRVHVMVAGMAVAFSAALPSQVFMYYLPRYGTEAMRRFAAAFIASPWPLLLPLFYIAGPVATAYAILRHRVFDIRIIVRQGIQYAAARGLLLASVPALAALFAIDLLLHGDQPLLAQLRERGWWYAALAAAAFALHLRRKHWLASLDRRFFRERYDARLVLRDIADEIRRAPAFHQVAPRVVGRIDSALHPEFAAVLMRAPGEAEFRALAAHPAPPPAIPATGKLMALVRVLGNPFEISQTGSGWLRQLPPEETAALRAARLEWLFPISLDEGRGEALLALGPKRSEEPYSREDVELLDAITASLAVLLERSPAPVVSEEPRLLAGRYRLDRLLGRGGMGSVYAGFDSALDREVAVKLIRPDLVASAEAQTRFRREAKAAAAFAHPNVVTVHDFGVDGERAYLVMELLRGDTLRAELRRSGRFAPARAAEILGGVCAAVEAAHARRLLHRDLKPENIFLARGIPKVLDFGVAKSMGGDQETRTSPGLLVGTVQYMSPEQLRGEPATESWDLWALAVVAYEMVAGAYPFAAAVAAEWQRAILSGRAIPIKTHLPQAPESWDRFFQRALAGELGVRPASATELFAAFRQAVC